MSGHWARGYLGLAGADQNGGNGGGGAMVLTVTKHEYDNRTIYELSKTWKEIKDALAEGTQMVLYGEGTGEWAGLYAQFMVCSVGEHDGIYTVYNYALYFNFAYEGFVLGLEEENMFHTTSEDGHPLVVINH